MKMRRRVRKYPRKTSLNKFSSDLLSESSLSAIAGIISARSTPRKVFKSLVLLVSLAGFFYQTVSFLSYVVQFPTMVDINIVFPENYEYPAFTFCNYNGISRSKFCSKHPTRCIVADHEMCLKYASFCKANETLVPKSEYYSLAKNMNMEDFLDLTQDADNFLYDLWSPNSNESFISMIKGPIMRPKTVLRDALGRVGCFSFNSLVESKEPPFIENIEEDRYGFPVFVFFFDVQEEDKFLPNQKSGMVLEIHSPYVVVNPCQTGIFMTPGRNYRIFIKMSTETLLSYPYDTDCVNYTEVWVSAKKTGPRSQDMCVQNCYSEIYDKFWNCVPPYILPSKPMRLCSKDLDSDLPNVDDKIGKCYKMCKKDCTKLTYNQVVQDRFTEDSHLYDDTDSHLNNLIVVEVYFDKSKVITFEHRPKYMDIEVFSYIGGFIGMWLGISLMQLSDFFDVVARIVYFYFNRRPKVNQNTLNKIAYYS